MTLLSGWVESRWNTSRPWIAIGIANHSRTKSLFFFLRGFSWALFLILIVLGIYLCGPWEQSFDVINRDQLLNAVLLGLGVGFAEEVIFRGWLLGEMIRLVGIRSGIVIQAVIFSFAHIRFHIPLNELLVLLFGLFLLGILLALRRILDGGSLWGAIAFHGSLVGLWFVINSGLIEIASNTPFWLIGPGQVDPNPIGGVVLIISMTLIVLYQRKAFVRSGGLLLATVRESSKGDAP